MRYLAFSLVLASAAIAEGPRTSWPTTDTYKNLYATNDYRGKTAPKIAAQTWLNGEPPSTRGKIVILDLWATWCAPCRATIPELNKIAAKFKKDVVVMGISDEAAGDVKKFMKKTPMNYFVGVDAGKGTYDKIGVQGIPYVLVISPDHVVRWQGFPLDSADPLTDKVVAQIIAASKERGI